MSQTVIATYEDGVLRPSEPLDLLPQAQVQLTIEQLPKKAETPASKKETVAMMKRLWTQTKAHQAPHLTRDELHERR